MYSVVLMMALSGSADMPAFGGRGGCCGCNGGGYSCGGCGGGHGGFFHRHGGCNGGGCNGGWGGNYGGCCGNYGGGCGGYGGGYGGGCCGNYGCGCSGNYGGCCGNYGCGGGMMYQGGGAPQGQPAEKVKPPKKESGEESMLSAPATIIVAVPAGAKLTIDGYEARATGDVRVFTTPALERHEEYSYTVKAEVTHDGRTVAQTKDVIVRAGEKSNVMFDLTEAVALR